MKYGISQKNIYWYILQKKGIMTAVVHLWNTPSKLDEKKFPPSCEIQDLHGGDNSDVLLGWVAVWNGW
jgi:hypothetical protein